MLNVLGYGAYVDLGDPSHDVIRQCRLLAQYWCIGVCLPHHPSAHAQQWRSLHFKSALQEPLTNPCGRMEVVLLHMCTLPL